VELELARPGSQRFLPPRAPNLQIPQVASSTAASATDENAESANSPGSYFEKIRRATPQEEGQVLWKRWPN
jgi:hypothetical protein